MFKKIELWLVCLIILIFIVCTIFFGALISNYYMHKYEWKTFSKGSFPKIQAIAIYISNIPRNIKIIINDEVKLKSLNKHKNKKRFNKTIDSNRNELLILPFYNGDLKSSEVNIVDINTFEVLHKYKHNVDEMNNLIKNSNEDFFDNDKFNSQERFLYIHPLILNDGSLVSSGVDGALFKLDFCSNLIWINQDERFHHSKNLSTDGNIWAITSLYPYSKIINKRLGKYGIGFRDDAITEINNEGKIIFSKSIAEILIENQIIGDNLFQTLDPIHANDVQPALSSSEYWQINDLFISIRAKSAIVHYRPSTNKVINYITGPFFQQHDVDIISDYEISIFNNNNNPDDNSKYSNQLVYNFKSKKFSTKFNSELKKNNFKTITEGGSEILKDGSLILDESNHGRIIILNKEGKKEIEFINKDGNGNIFNISWIRVIEDKELINKIREKKFKNKCLN